MFVHSPSHQSIPDRSPQIIPTLQRCIWAEISKSDNAIIDAVLDELIRTAADGGIDNPRCETISHIVATITSIGVRGRVYHKLRKVRRTLFDIIEN